jgi:hypothetical protein
MTAFGWTPPPDLSGPLYICPEAYAHMTNGAHKPARESPWFRIRSVPCRLTVVSPHTATFSKERMDRWVVVAKAVCTAIDGLSGPDARKPSSVRVTIYLWEGRKTLSPADAEISPRNANTGVCTRSTSGEADILVYRKEEAIKTLVHEMLHAYGFGDWANDDESIQESCWGIFRGTGLAIEGGRAWKPTEALVDALAVRLTVHVFGGASWQSCLKHAERVAALLASRFADGDGHWRQTTNAFEYYCVKPELMRRVNDLLMAHLAGLQQPDKNQVRELFKRISREYSKPASDPARDGAIGMRMTPPSLARPP